MPQQTDGPHVAERAAFAGTERASPVRAVPDAAVSIRPVPAPERDNLQRISGVDADIEDQLVREGITRYAQIANWSPTDVERFDQHFQPAGRIARENWIEQAQILSRGGDTAYSRQFDRRTSGETGVKPLAVKLGHAIAEQAAKTDREAQSSTVRLEALRSVRSQGLQDPEPGPEAAVRVAATNRVSGGQDDLKRIRGIGVLIEKKLKSMGVASYEQIANWTAQDIDRISQSLDFKGRIERENWVEQARILASGGTTEFSRRVDRGEVETSRYRS
jgi:predicted flap endonuclease-1-like 5' DNA nuclease